MYNRRTRCYGILAGQSSLGKLGGREVKTSALVSSEVVGSNPARITCEVFPQTLGKHWTYSAIHTSVYRTKLNQLFITRRKN